jgi:hypothetical protein
MCSNIQAILLYNIYIIYISVKSVAIYEVIFFKKNYEVIYIINISNIDVISFYSIILIKRIYCIIIYKI